MKKLAVAVLALLLFGGAPLLAQDDPAAGGGRTMHVTVYYAQVDAESTELDGGFDTEFEDGSALGASVNVFFTRHFSGEVAVFGIRADSRLLFEGTSLDLGNLDLVPITAGAQFHVLGNSRIDPYVGAGAAYIMAGDLNSPELDLLGLGRIELDNELSYYLNAGVGIQLGSAFGIVVDGRWIPYETSSRSTATGGEQDLEISPRLLSVGLRLRF